MNTEPVQRYIEIKDFLESYCKEHDFTEEDYENVEHFILEPARKEVANLIINDIINYYINNVMRLLPIPSATTVRHSVHKIHIKGKAVLSNE